MAERRMFAKTIIDSDAFLEMPISARLLYYDLGMRADDDGFINSPKKIMKMIGASEDDINILILRKFIIPFDNGVVVLKHWRIHNYIRKDTYNETPYKEQKKLLEIDDNKSYKLKDIFNKQTVDEPSTDSGRELLEKNPEYVINTESQRVVDEPSTQVRLGKVSIDNNKEEKKGKTNFDTILSESGFNEITKDRLKDFIRMRKAIKKPLTDRALELTIKRLKKISNSEEEIQMILDNSIINSYQGVFPLKEEQKKELKQNGKIKYKENTMSEKEYYQKMKGQAKKYE